MLVGALDETWYWAKIDLAMLRERLHRIEYTIMTGIRLEDIHGHTASGVDEQSIRLIFTDVSSNLANSVVLDGEDVNRSVFIDFIGVICIVADEFLCQLLGMLLCATKHLRDGFASCLQSEGYVGSQIARADNDDTHELMGCVIQSFKQEIGVADDRVLAVGDNALGHAASSDEMS